MQESKNYPELVAEFNIILDERLREDETTYLTAEESLDELYKKYVL
jgi:hypothetical protein